MSNLYLCVGALSQTPYYLSGLGVNVYSMDELCYYLVKDAYVLDSDLVDSRLCDFIDENLCMKKLAEKMRRMISNEETMGAVVSTILTDTGYCGEAEIAKVKQVLVDNASLSFASKRKYRGDKLLSAKRYARAIDEYQYALSSFEETEDPELYSSILHNIGTAYAQELLFDKAALYYKRAYELDRNSKSLEMYLCALRVTMRQDEFEKMMIREGYDERIVSAVNARMSDEFEEDGDEGVYEGKFAHIRDIKSDGQVSEYYKAVDELLEEWKQDYRRNMDAGTI